MVINKFDGFIYRFNVLIIVYWLNWIILMKEEYVWKIKKDYCVIWYISKEKGNLKWIYSLFLYFKYYLIFYCI